MTFSLRDKMIVATVVAGLTALNAHANENSDQAKGSDMQSGDYFAAMPQKMAMKACEPPSGGIFGAAINTQRDPKALPDLITMNVYFNDMSNEQKQEFKDGLTSKRQVRFVECLEKHYSEDFINTIN